MVFKVDGNRIVDGLGVPFDLSDIAEMLNNRQASAAREEVLRKLAEECGEVVPEVMKYITYGPNEANPFEPEKGNNRQRLSREIGDLMGMVTVALNAGLLDPRLVQESADTKEARFRKWSMHNQ